MNYRLLLQYDGTNFHGWQIQGELRTVQGELTRVLSLLNGSDVVVHGSGRTDAGVHAEGQVANVELHRQITPAKLCNAVNGNLANFQTSLSYDANNAFLNLALNFTPTPTPNFGSGRVLRSVAAVSG